MITFQLDKLHHRPWNLPDSWVRYIRECLIILIYSNCVSSQNLPLSISSVSIQSNTRSTIYKELLSTIVGPVDKFNWAQLLKVNTKTFGLYILKTLAFAQTHCTNKKRFLRVFLSVYAFLEKTECACSSKSMPIINKFILWKQDYGGQTKIALWRAEVV